MQGSAGVGLASALAAVDSGADLVATAVYPLALTLHRVSGESVAESLQGSVTRPGLDVDKLWEAADVIDEWIGDEPVAPVAPRIAVRAAEYDLPAGLVAALEVHLRAHAAADRLLEVLEEVGRVGRRPGGRRSPRRSARSSRRRRSCTCSRRGATARSSTSSASSCRAATARRPSRSTRRSSARSSCSRRAASSPRIRVTTEDVREQAEGLAASEEELVLIAMFGSDAEELLKVIRARHSRDSVLVAEDADAERGERIRELVKIVQESGVGEIEIEDEGMRVSVRRADEPVAARPPVAAALETEVEPAIRSSPCPTDGVTRVESPMVGVFYRAPNPGAPAFVDVGDTVVPGQVLCILEAMKLFNELKAESGRRRARDPRRERAAGRVRRAPVRARARPRAAGRLRDAPCSTACSSRTGARSPCA